MALNAGFSALIVMALGGWNTGRMMRWYGAVTGQALRAVAEAVSGGSSVERLRVELTPYAERS
jgi:(2Fe-2S) ferredoxin